MRKYILTILILSTWTTFLTGQNLVPNYSFEINDSCVCDIGRIDVAAPWFSPTLGSPDYLNSCVCVPLSVPSNFWGFENAKTGQAYAGLCLMFNYYWDSTFLSYREYIEVKLDSTLQAGTKYFVSFYVSLGDSVNWGTSNVGVYFSNDTIKNDTSFNNFNLIAQVENPSGNFLVNKIGWVKVSGEFIANGGEKFMTLGNFRDFYNTDTILVPGGITNNPGQSDWSSGYYYIDDIFVSSDSITGLQLTGLEDNSSAGNFKIYPNPTNQFATLEFNNSTKQNCTLTLYDLRGQVVRTIKNITTDKVEIERQSLASGLYFSNCAPTDRLLRLVS